MISWHVFWISFGICHGLWNQPVQIHTHPDIPDYQLTSSDPSSLNLDTVKQYSGYTSTPAGSRLFYWFFESRSNPSTDPVVIWLNGGPGCSSLEAVLFENGPANLNSDGSVVNNPWSWNKNASILYVDQPAGVGYSTASQPITDTVRASQDFTNFVKLWFSAFPEYSLQELHIAGESYAGRYIPVFAEALLTDPTNPIKVHSIMIGNGLVSAEAEYQSYQPFLCGSGGFESVLSQGQCSSMRNSLDQCLTELETCQNNGLQGFSCSFAQYACNEQETPWREFNPYDVRDSSCQQTETGLCYPGLDDVQEYFNGQQVKSVLGADPNVNYQVCNNNMNSNFNSRHDGYALTIQNITNILGLGVPVLAFHGDKDIILNWISGKTWTGNVQWSGQKEFQQALNTPRPWKPSGSDQNFGSAVNHDILTFLRVDDSGHMVPHDQPKAAWYMFNAWVNHKDYSFSH